MDASLQAHLNAMRNAGGEHPGHGIFGIALFKDMPGFGKAQGLEDLMRMLLSANAHGLSGGAGKPGGLVDKILNAIKGMFDYFKEMNGGSIVSGGTHHDGPASSGLDNSRNEVGHVGSGISYD